MHMEKRVTIQDIADALGLSRNTVSKAINNSGGLADSTRDAILQKAVEMGYKQFSYVSAMTGASFTDSENRNSLSFDKKEIALLTASSITNNSHFAGPMMDKFTKEISQMGLHLVSYRVTKNSIDNLTLPRAFMKENTLAVMCIEIFDQAYSEMICTLGLPVLFVDCPPVLNGRGLNADVLLMNNTSEITRFLHQKIEEGVKRVGFIGNYHHCQSFYERYLAFRAAMMLHGLPAEEKDIYSTESDNPDEIARLLEEADDFPELFICANDFVAVDAMLVLRSRGIAIPDEVKFMGFDDSPESRGFSPALSTVHIHTQAMAFSAIQLLIARIKEPSMEPRIVHVATDLILRESSGI